jgi:hypothetical protein
MLNLFQHDARSYGVTVSEAHWASARPTGRRAEWRGAKGADATARRLRDSIKTLPGN